MYVVVFSWYIVRVFVRSGVLGVGVVMHAAVQTLVLLMMGIMMSETC